MKAETRQGLPALADLLVKRPRIELVATGIVCAIAIFAAGRLLSRGVWFDEIFTLSMTGPGISASEFMRLLIMDAHPALHFLLVEGLQLMGVTSLVALRLVNLLALPLIVWVVWLGERNGALTRSQSLLIAILAASSFVFIDNFAEARSYFLVASSSLATMIVWRTLTVRIEASERISRGLLIVWGVVLGVLVNLQYFATIMGGLITIALLAHLLVRRDLTQAIRVGLVSMLAAAPAVLLAAVQMQHQPEQFWIMTTPIEALELFVQFLRAVVLNNIAAAGLVVIGVMLTLERRVFDSQERAGLIAIAIVVAFFTVAFIINLGKPMVIPRYLTPAIGPIILGMVMFATREGMSKWTVTLIAAFAMLAQAEAIVTHKHERGGWDESAVVIQNDLKACPNTKVYAQWDTGPGFNYEFNDIARKKGYDYVSAKHGFTYTAANSGDTISPSGECPSIIWAEHVYQLVGTGDNAENVLRQMGLKTNGTVEYVRTSSAALIYVK